MTMLFLSYLFPQEIYKGSSKFSSDIRVIEDTGSLRLLVNGIEQSGRYIDKILNRALDACRFSPNVNGKKILILGLGGGTLIRKFRSVFPDSTIDVVDIDPVIIYVAQTYFGLQDGKGLKIIQSDAGKFVHEITQKKHKKYSLIVVDLYIGRTIPDFVWEHTFIEQIHSLLDSNGSIFINIVHDGKYEDYVKKLGNTLCELFSKTQVIPIDYNTFFFASV